MAHSGDLVVLDYCKLTDLLINQSVQLLENTNMR